MWLVSGFGLIAVDFVVACGCRVFVLWALWVLFCCVGLIR